MSSSRQLKLRDGKDRLEKIHHVVLDGLGVVAIIGPGRSETVGDLRVGKIVDPFSSPTIVGAAHHRNIPGWRITLDDQEPHHVKRSNHIK